MNRRSFFKRMAVGAAAAAVVAAAPEAVVNFLETKPVAATVSGYANYANFSYLALSESMDEVVQNCAIELGYRAGMSISDLYAATLG